MSRKKNKLFVERMKATKRDNSNKEKERKREIEVEVDVTSKKPNQPKQIQDKIVVKLEKQQEIKQSPQNATKKTDIFVKNVFARMDAQVAEQRRKEKYLEVVYKKIQEENSEDFDR